MSALEPSRIARTAATTVGWLVFVVLRALFLLPGAILGPLLRWAARAVGPLWGTPAARPVAELGGLLEEQGETARTFKTIATKSRPSDVVGIVRGRILRGGSRRGDDEDPSERWTVAADVRSTHPFDDPLKAAYAAAPGAAGAPRAAGARGAAEAPPVVGAAASAGRDPEPPAGCVGDPTAGDRDREGCRAGDAAGETGDRAAGDDAAGARRAGGGRGVPAPGGKPEAESLDAHESLEGRGQTAAHAAQPGGHRAARIEIVEFGLAGVRPPVVPLAPKALPLGAAVSAWIPGSDAAAALAWLERIEREARAFRLLFPERAAAPAAEARRLYRGGAIGTPIQALIKVCAHPDRLLDPERALRPLGWLDEPVLNRVPAAAWLNGPVTGARVVRSVLPEGALALVCILKHARPGRLTIVEACVSPDLVRGGQPAITDRLECTGRDGFLRVHGILEAQPSGPRLQVHRGALEQVRRDLPRGPARLYEAAAQERDWAKRPARSEYDLARQAIEGFRRVALAARAMRAPGVEALGGEAAAAPAQAGAA